MQFKNKGGHPPIHLNVPRIGFYFSHFVFDATHCEGEFLCIDNSFHFFVVEWEFHYIVVDFVQTAWNVGAMVDLQIIALDCPTPFYLVFNGTAMISEVNAHDDSLHFELDFLIIKFPMARNLD